MRIVIDLQGAQCGSRHRGIGRYSLALALAMVRNRGDHEIIIALNSLFADTVEPIRAAFDGLLPQNNIRVWYAPGPVHGFDSSNNWRRRTAELMREFFLASLNPDIVHVSSLIEGFGDDAVHSIGLLPQRFATAVTFYDLIPLIQRDVYLDPNPAFEILYTEKLEHLKRADLYLAISDSAQSEVINYLGVGQERTINIQAATEDYFKPAVTSRENEQLIREKFGLRRPFLMYSGATDERKNHLRLIKAFSNLPKTIRKKYQLAIVGGLPNDHRAKFESYIHLCGLKLTDVLITGRVTDAEMATLYRLCDLFVFPSWHEGFGLPALEAMSCGAPVIGSNTTSLPEVIGRSDALFDPFDVNSIAQKMADALTNESFRTDLRRHGLEQCKKFSWDESAKRALTAFEKVDISRCTELRSNQSSLLVHNNISQIIDKISKISNAPTEENDWIATARAISLNHSNQTHKQLLVDVSELMQRDPRTGIQRVVRSVLAELISSPPEGFRIEPVYATPHKPGYKYARRFAQSFLGQYYPETTLANIDEPVDISSEDIFFGLDLHHLVLQQSEFYSLLKSLGVKTYFIVYDLGPILLPKFFPKDIPSLHAQWLGTLVKADGVICISRAVADEVIEWLDVFGPKRLRALSVGWFHLGGDLAGSVPTKGLPLEASDILSKLLRRPSFLSVGTLEPRKGHMQTLLAFEQLWDEGLDVNLVIVGRQGWNVALLIEMLRAHSEFGKRLFWLDGISDEFLEKVYAASACLIAASEAEGFGLPLIEAAQNKLPIIARDIPVFREVAGNQAFYFSGLEPKLLGAAVRAWLMQNEIGKAPQSTHMPWLTWKQSTNKLLDVLLHGKWYRKWMPDGLHRFWGSDSRLGTQVGDRSGRNIASTAKAGYLVFGPYIPLEVGAYQVTIRGHCGANSLAGARMDVAADKGKHIYGHAPLNHPDERGCFITLPIKLDEACSDLEVRIWVSAKSDLHVSMIEIAPVNDDIDLMQEEPPEVTKGVEARVVTALPDPHSQRIDEVEPDPVVVLGRFQSENPVEVSGAIKIAPLNDGMDLAHEEPPEVAIEDEGPVGSVSAEPDFQRIDEAEPTPATLKDNFQSEDAREVHRALENMVARPELVTAEIEEHALPTPERTFTVHSISDQARKHANRLQSEETALVLDKVVVSEDPPSTLAASIERKASNAARNKAKAARKKNR
jgi:glycosyltransferase involved in cell wall biosynthesis